MVELFLFFFFQAEDGIRDLTVTGVQTCALPISRILAKALNCVKGPTPEPCGVCDSCKEIAAGASLDEIGRASCRERGEISVVAVSLKKKKNKDIYTRRFDINNAQ